MSDFIFHCPYCKTGYRVTDQDNNSVINCHFCKRPMTIICSKEYERQSERTTRQDKSEEQQLRDKKRILTFFWGLVFITVLVMSGIAIIDGLLGINKYNGEEVVGHVFISSLAVTGIYCFIYAIIQKKIAPLIATIIFISLFTLCVKATRAHKEKKESTGEITSSSYIADNQRIVITRDVVVAETKKAIKMAEAVSKVKSTGFSVDECIIGDSEAVCHFHCYAGSVRHIGAVKFRIDNGKLIPVDSFLNKDSDF